MTTLIGTCHFVNRRRLVEYYKSQGHDIKSIQQKLEEGACFVGRPKVEKGDIVVLNDEGRYLIEDDPHVKMRGVKVLFREPEFDFITSINGTRKEVCKHYNNWFNVAPMGSSHDLMKKPKGVTFLDDDGHVTFFFE